MPQLHVASQGCSNPPTVDTNSTDTATSVAIRACWQYMAIQWLQIGNSEQFLSDYPIISTCWIKMHIAMLPTGHINDGVVRNSFRNLSNEAWQQAHWNQHCGSKTMKEYSHQTMWMQLIDYAGLQRDDPISLFRSPQDWNLFKNTSKVLLIFVPWICKFKLPWDNQTWHPQFHTRDKVHLCAHLRMTKPLPSTLNNTKRQTHYLVSQSKGVALKTEKPERKKAMNIMKQKLKSKHS